MITVLFLILQIGGVVNTPHDFAIFMSLMAVELAEVSIVILANN